MSDAEEHTDLPPELLRAIRDADQVHIITSAVDREIQRRAAEQFADAPHRNRWQPLLASAAAAGVLAISLAIWQAQPSQPTAITTLTDINGSGQIDIGDVIALARAEPGRYSRAELDQLAHQLLTRNNAS